MTKLQTLLADRPTDAPIESINPSAVREDLAKTIGLNPQLSTVGGVFTSFLNYALVFAGLILFVMILWGGFEMLTGASDTKAQEKGKQRITAAAIGFVLLFSSYWIVQIIQLVFGVNILSF